MAQTLEDCSILVVENEPMIGFAIAEAVRGAGGKVIGPVASCKQALLAIAEHRLHGAILEIAPRGEPVFGYLDPQGRPPRAHRSPRARQ